MSTVKELKDKLSIKESTDTTHKIYNVSIKHNYYVGKYHDYGVRNYPIIASSPEHAQEIAKTHKDKIEAHLRTMRDHPSRKLIISPSDKYHYGDKDVGTASLSTAVSSKGVIRAINHRGEFVDHPHNG